MPCSMAKKREKQSCNRAVPGVVRALNDFLENSSCCVLFFFNFCILRKQSFWQQQLLKNRANMPMSRGRKRSHLFFCVSFKTQDPLPVTLQKTFSMSVGSELVMWPHCRHQLSRGSTVVGTDQFCQQERKRKCLVDRGSLIFPAETSTLIPYHVLAQHPLSCALT